MERTKPLKKMDKITFLHNTNSEIYGIITELKQEFPDLGMAVSKLTDASAEIHKRITQLLKDETEKLKEDENKSSISESKGEKSTEVGLRKN